MMHKTIMGATHFFFLVGYRWLPRAGGAGKCYKSIYGQLRWNMWEYELIRYRLVGGRPPRSVLLQSGGARSTSGRYHRIRGRDSSQQIAGRGRETEMS